MASLTETLNFLTDAGHLLATIAPESSAYLMNQRNGLMLENGLEQTDSQRQHVCDRCGHIMVMGKQSSLDFKPVKIKKQKGCNAKKPESRESGPTKIITCGRCDAKTHIKLPAPAPILRHKFKPPKVTKGTTIGSLQPPPTATALSLASAIPQEASSSKTSLNASSKKRAKSRKAGLQALLEQSKSSRPGLGLSLADFMSK
ncbi:hypothetical protein QBC43DRAFT_14201 [Cladorrhinum sp. PSN259]|nr:hypothetical protein QBC43DRAFT_14201 [Cladorrhinum sp. PSN259]